MDTRVKICPKCGKTNSEWMQFCKECFTSLNDIGITYENSVNSQEIPPITDGLNTEQEERHHESEQILKKIAELAHSRTDQAVDAIIQVANGIKSLNPGTWRTFWISTPSEYYTLEEQLAAIDALAETGSKRALGYLERLRQGQIEIEETDRTLAKDGYTKLTGRTVVEHYPNAHGPLRNALRMEIRENAWGTGDWDHQTLPIISRLDTAIKKLKSS